MSITFKSRAECLRSWTSAGHGVVLPITEGPGSRFSERLSELCEISFWEKLPLMARSGTQHFLTPVWDSNSLGPLFQQSIGKGSVLILPGLRCFPLEDRSLWLRTSSRGMWEGPEQNTGTTTVGGGKGRNTASVTVLAGAAIATQYGLRGKQTCKGSSTPIEPVKNIVNTLRSGNPAGEWGVYDAHFTSMFFTWMLISVL